MGNNLHDRSGAILRGDCNGTDIHDGDIAVCARLSRLRIHRRKEMPIMGKKYYVEDSEAVADVCLNCTKPKCRGFCEEFKRKKEKILESEKKKNRGSYEKQR